MKLSMLISPGIWDLLERLRPHLDLTLDLFDPSLEPLVPDCDHRTAVTLRALATTPREAGAASPIQSALRTGQHLVFSSEGLSVALFPIRHERTPVGLLALADSSTDPRALARLERLGWSMRGTIESDISVHSRLGGEERRSRWLASTLRFLEHLDDCQSQDELFQTLVEGAAIWGDFDARVYRRDLAGTFHLAAALAPVMDRDAASRFPSALVDEHPRTTRITGISDLEAFGWGAMPGEVLLTPIPLGEPPDFLFAVGGVVGPELERVFSVACRTLGRRLAHLRAERERALRARLSARVSSHESLAPAAAAAILADVTAETGAAHGRILLEAAEHGAPPRVLAAIGGSPMSRLPTTFPSEGSLSRPDRVIVALRAGARLAAWLDLGVAPGRDFTPAEVKLAEVAGGVIQGWLAGVMQARSPAGPPLSDPAGMAFEARIQEEIERARRFNLEAGLLVFETPASRTARLTQTPIVGEVRSQLRSSDLIGRLASGDLAALLVHTDVQGIEAVAGRVQRRLARLSAGPNGPAAILGTAAYPSAGETASALVSAARQSLARRRPQPLGR
jgi:hypothetical protein